MRILIDIGHPGHVHLFRPFAQEMIKRDSQVLFTCRQKEFETELLESAGFTYRCFGKHFQSKVGKIWGLLKFNIQMVGAIRKFNPDIVLSHGSIYAAQSAWLMKVPHIALEDTGNMEQVKLYEPFTSAIIAPKVLSQKLSEKQIPYNGYHELFYLHPNHFQPNESTIRGLHHQSRNKLAILRFVAHKASHDFSVVGLNDVEKENIVEILKSHYKVYISSESSLPPSLQKYKLEIEPNQIHHFLAYADLVISEGSTIASESAVLGTPTIFINNLEQYCINDQKEYGLVLDLRNSNNSVFEIQRMIESKKLKQFNSRNREKMLSEKINPTPFLVWFIENWPNSFDIVKEDPDYPNRFKSSAPVEAYN